MQKKVMALYLRVQFFLANPVLCPRPLIVPTQSISSMFVNFAAKDKTPPYDITIYKDITK